MALFEALCNPQHSKQPSPPPVGSRGLSTTLKSPGSLESLRSHPIPSFKKPSTTPPDSAQVFSE